MTTRRIRDHGHGYRYSGPRGDGGAKASPGNARAQGPGNGRSRVELQRETVLSRGLVLGVALVFCALMLIPLGNMRGAERQMKTQLSTLEAELALAELAVRKLEIRVEDADDPARIHAMAVNRLGMQMPKAEQVIAIPRAAAGVSAEPIQTQQSGGLFGLLLDFLGF